MKFAIEKDLFAEVLSKIQGITGRKSNLAITTSVLLTAAEGKILIKATDLETGFEGTYPADVESTGTVALNCKKLSEIVTNFPSDRVVLNEVENRWIEIGNDRIEYHIVGMNPEDFPEIPQVESVELFPVEASALRRMIDRVTAITGAGDDKRAHIIGTLFEALTVEGRNGIRMVATDGSRLTKVDYFFDEEMALPQWEGVLVPKKGLTDINKFLDWEGPVQVGIHQNHFVIQKDAQTIIVRLLEGDFPKYETIVQKSGGTVMSIVRRSFLLMLKRMSILASDNYRGIIFTFETQKLIIRSTNPDLGESKEDMTVEYDGPTIKVAFNPRFFIDALNLIDDDNVKLTMVDEEKPCLLEGESDDFFLTVIMPMRI